MSSETERTIVYQGYHKGRLPRGNERLGARTIAGKARMFSTAQYKQNKRDMAVSFSATWPSQPIDYAVDMVIKIALWKRIDSDACVKGVMDSLEDAGVVANDKQIRDIVIRREYHPRDTPDSVECRLYLTGEERISI
ncbi:MAG: RusA family crossover junction endodeoxyribonuclease [Chloroflexota bacterium]